MSVKCPAIAAAAAIIGLTKCVRPPRPCRPSKFRLLVEAQRSPGCRMSGFIPRHIEHPDSRHSNPASRKMRCNPSCSAARLIVCDPGTTIARTFGFTCCPFATRAAARRSSMRELVHEPINTRSTAIDSIGVPGSSPMYASACSAARRSLSCAKVFNSGTRALTGTTIPGFVPQVTNGASIAASISITRSNCAPGSPANVLQYPTAASQSFPLGAKRRPLTYANVVSSGSISPARAPASILILHSVIRPSIDNARTGSPAYSITNPVAPSVPMRPIIPSARSLAVTPSASSPVTWICIVFGFFCGRHWVASTCSTSDVPMPNASEPNAPCVEVWLSPQTIVIPGRVMPSSGPITWTMPCSAESMSNNGTPNSRQFFCSASICFAAIGSVIGRPRGVVGMLWSTVATVRSGCRTGRPLARSPSNACGDVTSCTRCRSI